VLKSIITKKKKKKKATKQIVEEKNQMCSRGELKTGVRGAPAPSGLRGGGNGKRGPSAGTKKKKMGKREYDQVQKRGEKKEKRGFWNKNGKIQRKKFQQMEDPTEKRDLKDF